MSKISKLIKNPKLYFKDALLKYGFLKQKKANSINIFESYSACLHIGESENHAFSHVQIWFDYFMASGLKFVILTRDNAACRLIIEKFPEAKVVCAINSTHIKEFFEAFPTIRICLYPSNTANNFHMLAYTHIKHVFIGHGDSDKSASAHKFFRAYDENWVSGDAHIDRIKNAGFALNGLENIKVGRPALYEILSQNLSSWQERYQGQLNLLYLPTWEGAYAEQDYSSLERLIQNIRDISNLEKLNISVKLHPFTGKREKRYLDLYDVIKEEENINLIPTNESLSSHIINSNLFICDISAAVSECLALDAPIFLYVPKDKNIKIAKSNMEYEDYCYIYRNSNELVNLILEVLSGNDYLVSNRKKAQKYIINIEDTLNQKFIQKLQNEGNIC